MLSSDSNRGWFAAAEKAGDARRRLTLLLADYNRVARTVPPYFACTPLQNHSLVQSFVPPYWITR